MSTIESKFNGYPKVTDWNKVYFLLQQANSPGFNSATKKEIVNELFGDAAIQGADYEDLPISTSSAVVPLPIPEADLKYGFLTNGKFSQPNGPTLEYTSTQMGLTLFDGIKWVKKFTLNLPKGEDGKSIEDWSAKNFTSGSQVYYNTKIYKANADTIASDIPGTSSKWTEKVGSVALDVIGGAASYDKLKIIEDNKALPIVYLGSNSIFSVPGYVATSGNFAVDGSEKRTDYIRVFKGDKVTARCKTGIYAIRFYNLYKEAKGGTKDGTVVGASLMEAVFNVTEDGFIITSNYINAQIPSADSVWLKIETSRFLEKNEKGKVEGVALFDDVEKLLSKNMFGERSVGTDFQIFSVTGSYVQPTKVLSEGLAANFKRTGFRRGLKGQTVRVRTSISTCCIPVYDDNFVLMPDTLVTGQSSWQTPEGGQTLQIGEITLSQDSWILVSHTLGGTVAEKYIYFEINNGIVQSKSQTDTKGGAASHERVAKLEDTSTRIDKSFRTTYRYPSKASSGAVCFIDDDGAKAFYDYLLPYMIGKGLPIGTAIVPNWIKPHRYIYETAGIFIPIMTMTEVADVAYKVRSTNMVEILCHTWNHEYFNNSRSELHLRQDIEQCMSWFGRYFKIQPRGIVYPSGRRDNFSMRIASGSFDYGFNTDGTAVVAKRVNRIGTLKNHDINRIDFGTSSSAVDIIKAAITDAKATGGLVVITTHWKGYNQYATDQADWEALCDWIIASGITPMLPSDAFATFGNTMESDNGKFMDANLVLH